MFNLFKKKEFYLELDETPEQKEQEEKKAADIASQTPPPSVNQTPPAKVEAQASPAPAAVAAPVTSAPVEEQVAVEEEAEAPVVPEPPKEVNFADPYLMGGPRRDRRTAGPSLDTFKTMARSVNR